MKRLFAIALVAALAVLGGCQSQSPAVAAKATSPLVGTWEFVSGTYTTPGKPPAVYDASDMHAMKVITPTHFAFVSVLGDGKFYAAGSGPYTIKGDAHGGTYTETIEYASVPSMVGKGYPFSYRIEGDRWYHEGDEDGTHVEEVWQRVK
ncbi:MAG TPA: hypothetical protein VFJ15_04810 [Oleiagrimonas sp.]|nr:hypothetical protein [Oleiagrimonas sp.]